MRASLLLHEPEPETREYLGHHLRADGFEVHDTPRPAEALRLAERAGPDLVVAGEADLCARLRRGRPGGRWNRDVPVIVLAGPAADPVDRVRAFEHGADDVLERPVAYLELLARIQALLRRSSPVARERLVAGDLVVDRRTRQVRVRGAAVRLAGKEFELVAALASEPTRVFTKDELLRDVWGFRCAVRTRTLDSHASRLRRKLGEASGGDRFVVNVWGVGYRLLD